METIKINGVERKDFGKKGSKDVRREGMVPAVVYGGHEAPVHFSIEEKAGTIVKLCIGFAPYKRIR